MSEIFLLKAPQPELPDERDRLLALVGSVVPHAEILEVGSTAVEGVIGKQDLDILVRVAREDFVRTRGRLDREFVRDTQQLSNEIYQGYLVPSTVDAALQLTVRGSQYDRFSLFLDALREDPGLVSAYNALKRRWHGRPMHEYRIEKAAFIGSVLRRFRGRSGTVSLTRARFATITLDAQAWISFRVIPTGWIFDVQHMNSSEDFSAWEQIRCALLERAFLLRDVYVITESPQVYSWARDVIRLRDPERDEFKDSGIRLLAIRMDDCQPETLAVAGIDDEFIRGVMWFSTPVVGIRKQSVEILRSRISAGLEEELLCEVGYEVMSCEGDGRQVVWCSPGLEFEPFVRWFRDLCAKRGFRVAIDMRA